MLIKTKIYEKQKLNKRKVKHTYKYTKTKEKTNDMKIEKLLYCQKKREKKQFVCDRRHIENILVRMRHLRTK